MAESEASFADARRTAKMTSYRAFHEMDISRPRRGFCGGVNCRLLSSFVVTTAKLECILPVLSSASYPDREACEGVPRLRSAEISLALQCDADPTFFTCL